MRRKSLVRCGAGEKTEMTSNSYLLLLCGAFSSNRGSDFREVLKEIANAEIPMPENNKWANAGLVECDDCQIAWRVLDAQHFGVPQRRKRIFLVADFRKSRRCAGEILFERESSHGNSETGGKARESASQGIEGSSGSPSEILSSGGKSAYPINLQVATRHNSLGERTGFGIADKDDPAYTLEANHSHGVAICSSKSSPKEGLTPWDVQSNRIQPIDGIQPALYGGAGQGTHNGAIFDTRKEGKTDYLTPWDHQEKRVFSPDGVSPCLSGSDGGGGRTSAGYLMEKSDIQRKEKFVDIYNGQITGNIAPSLTTASGLGNTSGPKVMTNFDLYDMTHADEVMRKVNSGKCQTLNARMGTGGNQVPVLRQKFSDSSQVKAAGFKIGNSASARSIGYQEEVSPTLSAMDSGNKPAVFVRNSSNKEDVTTDNHGNPLRGGISYNVHQNVRAEVTLSEQASALTTGGGKPGQGYPCIFQNVSSSSDEEIEDSPMIPSDLISDEEIQKPKVKFVSGGFSSQRKHDTYSLDSLSSNSMKSSNPHSGFHKTDVAKTLDTTNPDPSKNQGGILIQEISSEEKEEKKIAYCLSGNIVGRDPKNGGNHLGVDKDVAFTLNTVDRHVVAVPSSEVEEKSVQEKNPIVFEPGIASRDGGHVYHDGKAPTLRAQPGDNHPAVAYCLQGSMIGRSDKNGPQGDGINKDIAFTLNTIDRHAVSCYGLDQQGGKGSAAISKDISPTIMSNSHGTPHAVAVITSENENPVDNADKDVDKSFDKGNLLENQEKMNPIKNGKTVRRLTPMEAERLQGLPDGYTLLDNKLCSDSARYKALGNGMAMPCPVWILQRIVEVVNKYETMEKSSNQ